MNEFLVEEALPFLGVCAATLGLTLTLFDVPANAPAPVSAPAETRASTPAIDAPPGSLPTPAMEPGTQPMPSALVPRLDAMNALLAQAIKTLGPRMQNAGVPDMPAPRAPNGVLPTAPGAGPAVDPNFLAVVPSLSQAIQAARDARTEEDLVRAESMMHAATDQMQVACGTTGGPLCDSARRMRSLGF